MHTIRLDVSNDIYDKVMTFIENLPKNKVKLHEKKEEVSHKKEPNSLIEFFQSSPLVGEISLERDKERVEF